MDQLFLVGTISNWETQDDFAFNRRGENIHTLLVEFPAGSHEFKIAGGASDESNQFGSDGNHTVSALNKLIYLKKGGPNIVLNLNQSGLYFISVDLSQSGDQQCLKIVPKYLSSASGDKTDRFGFGVDHFLDIELPVSFQIGQADLRIGEAMALGQGSIIELDRMEGEPVDVYVGGKRVAIGEIVIMQEEFGVRILEILSPKSPESAAGGA